MTTTSRPVVATMLCGALAQAAFAQPPTGPSPAEMVKRADTDGDGKVSRDEFIKARTAALEESFARMDTDGDGKLDVPEAEAAAERVRSMAPAGREGFRRAEGLRSPRPDDPRTQPSAGDRPQRADGGALGEQAFDRLDGDGDGNLSREEFATGMARMREFMQRGGQGPGGPGGLGRPERGGGTPAEGFRQPPQQD